MAGTTDWSDFSTDPFGTLGSAVGNNPGLALGALGLGATALRGNQMPKGYNQLQQEAQSLGSQGGQLLQEAQTGTLPPSAQAGILEAAHASAARIRQSYAAQGLSGSTMEAQALQAVSQQAQAATWKELQGLYQTGLQMTGMSTELLGQVMQANVQQDQDFMKAVVGFASSLGGANGGQGGGNGGQ